MKRRALIDRRTTVGRRTFGPPTHSGFGWPDILRMKQAALYVGVHPLTLKRAVQAGRLELAGRCGRTMVFHRSSLDAFLLGTQVIDTQGR